MNAACTVPMMAGKVGAARWAMPRRRSIYAALQWCSSRRQSSRTARDRGVLGNQDPGNLSPTHTAGAANCAVRGSANRRSGRVRTESRSGGSWLETAGSSRARVGLSGSKLPTEYVWQASVPCSPWRSSRNGRPRSAAARREESVPCSGHAPSRGGASPRVRG